MTAVKGKTPKCQVCKEWVDKSLNDFEKTSKGYYHNACYQTVAQDGQHYKELIAYVCDSFNLSKPPEIVLTQIKHFKEKKNMKYKGMEMTLRYLIEIEGLFFTDIHKSGIQIIEWNYDKARMHYENEYYAVESFNNVVLDTTPERFTLKRDERNSSRKLINIEDL